MPHVALAALAFGPRGFLEIALFLALVVVAGVVAFRAYRDTEPALADGPRRLMTAVRFVVLVLVVVMLAEPVLHQSRTTVTAPGVVVLVDDSASMSVRGADERTRAESADAIARDVAQRLSERPERPRVWIERGARRVENSAERGRDELSASTPTRDGTDLGGLVLSSVQRHLEDNLAGVVLISDGRSTTDGGPSLAGLDVGVWSVAVGDSAGPVDLRLDRVRYPTFVNQGDRVAIEAEVIVESRAAGETTVRLRRGDVTVESRPVSWPAGGGRVPIDFEVAADSLGVQRLALEVEAGPGELVERNNRVQVGFEVGKDRLRVLYVERAPSWNAHFLARFASRDRRIEWIGVHGAEGGLRIAGTDSTLRWPLEPDVLRDIDLFAAGSLDDASFLLADGTGVRESVRAGAGLMVLFGDGDRLASIPEGVRSLLPLRPGVRSRWTRGDVRPEITAAGRTHPILAAPPELGDLDAWLRTVPPLRAVALPVDVAADADVLLRGVNVRFASPVLALREEGEGRVAAINGAPLWSWSFWRLGDDDSEPLYRAWMGNLVAHLAEGGERARLRLQLPGPVVAQGDDVPMRAVALDARLRPDETTDVWLEWTRGTVDSTAADVEPMGRVRMRQDPRTPGGRSVSLPALPPDDYSLRVTMESAGGPASSGWQPLTVDAYSVEFRDPGVDRAALTSLSRRTGGGILDTDEIVEWAGSLPLPERETVLAGRLDLWASLWLLIPLLGLLGLEWALRKRWGLI